MRVQYERPSRGQRENAFFETFKGIASDMPEGTWMKSESPDYLLQTPSVTIGLEVTSLVDKRRAAIKSAQDKVLDIARKAAEEAHIDPIEVTVQFRDNDSPIDSAIAAAELFELVRLRIGQVDDRAPKEFTPVSSRHFTGIIVQLGTSGGIAWLKAHRWHRMHINWMRRDPILALQAAIQEKNDKLPEYLSRCQECWLLVGVNEWVAPEAIRFTEEGLKHSFETDFRRVYLLENVQENLYRLQLIPSTTAHG